MVIPVIGALATGLQIPLIDLIILLIIGLLVNIWGFTHNEYLDVDVDSASKDLSDKPLVKGTIPIRHSIIISYVSLILVFTIVIIYFFNIIALVVFALSIALAAIYNIIGKKFAGIDFLLGGWASFFCIFGALLYTFNIDIQVLIFALLILLQWWFANIVEGGVKDAEHDFDIGVKNTTTWWGVRVVRGKVKVPLSYKIFGLCLTLGYIILMVYPYIFLGFSYYIWQLIILIILVGIVLWSGIKIVTIVKFSRNSILKYIIFSELAKAFTPLVILISIMGINAIFLIEFLFLWTFIFHIYEFGTRPPSI